MKRFIEKAHESALSIIEIALLIVAFLVPTWIDVANWIEMCFKATEVNFDNVKYYFLKQAGNWAIGGLLLFFVLCRIRKYNEKKTFNTKNVYHDHSYAWYWFCSKVLGYKKCNLKLVPIYMQMKLVLRDTFEEYFTGTDEDFLAIINENINIEKIGHIIMSNEISFVLADTYSIIEAQIPEEQRYLPTIVISRTQKDCIRCYSSEFIEKIIYEIRNLPSSIQTINLFATTNPKHTFQIAQGAFKLAERGNIKKLVVYQQSADYSRKFKPKGKTIYSRL